ncbi:MAG TPA: MFS transporter [Ktedonobacterales bacterium]
MSSPTGRPALRRDRAFRAIWAGQTASLFGDQVTGLALPWLILLQTRSPLAAGVIAALRYVPLVALGLVAGVAADHVSRHALMIASDAGRALALGAVAVLGLLRLAPPLWALALVVLALGTGQLFFQIAYRAWLPEVTGEARLARATAALEASDAASVLVGYPLAGALIAAVGPVLALGADALSYVVSALTLGWAGNGERGGRGGARREKSERTRRTRRTREEREGGKPEGGTAGDAGDAGDAEDAEDAEDRGALDEALAGVRLILRTPAQRVLKGAGAALYLDAGATGVLLATLTQLRLHLPATLAGVIFGAAGVGGLIGSALAPRLYERGWRRELGGALAVAALGAMGLAVAGLLAPAPGFALAFAANLTLDGAVALGFVLTGTANTLVTPPELRGRVNAASTIYSSAVRGVAAIGAGALAAAGDPLPAFLALAGCCLVASGIAWGRRAGA